LEADAPFYDAQIDVPTGATLTGEAESFSFEIIGMEKDSLSNLGFGLYGENGFGIYKKYDIFGNFTQSRQNIYLVKEQLNIHIVIPIFRGKFYINFGGLKRIFICLTH
jgi:hypothetical protein